MVSTTAATVAHHPRDARTALQRAATVVFVAEILAAVALFVAIGVIGAADAAGLDLLVPAPGPMPMPSVAPPGLDL